jgi:MFS superfamily sulfate permease-like transporter
LFDAESAPFLDVIGADVLETLRLELNGQGIVFCIARSKGWFRAMLERTGLAERIGAEHIFPTLEAEAVAFHSYIQEKASSREGLK